MEGIDEKWIEGSNKEKGIELGRERKGKDGKKEE